jgi:hypothetical protein
MSKGCKMTDYQNCHLNTDQWENEVQVIPKRDGKTSSWKRVEEYRINKPSQQLKKKKENIFLCEASSLKDYDKFFCLYRL